MSDLQTRTDVSDPAILDGERIKPLQIEVDKRNLHHSDSCWRPEMEKLAEQVAAEILRRLEILPEGDEVLLAEIHGFPGIDEIQELQSSEAMGTSSIRGLIRDQIVERLKTKGIVAEIAYNHGSKPRNPVTQIMILQWNDHEDSSYQRSKLQYFARKHKPQAVPDAVKSRGDESSVISAGNRRDGIRDRFKRWWAGV